MAFVLTQPVGGSISSAELLNISVPAGTTVSVDQLSCSTNAGAKWFLVIKNQNTLQTIAQEVLAVQKNCIPKHTRYALVGDIIPHGINVVSSAGQLLLQVTNPSVDPYSVDVVRIQVLE